VGDIMTKEVMYLYIFLSSLQRLTLPLVSHVALDVARRVQTRPGRSARPHCACGPEIHRGLLCVRGARQETSVRLRRLPAGRSRTSLAPALQVHGRVPRPHKDQRVILGTVRLTFDKEAFEFPIGHELTDQFVFPLLPVESRDIDHRSLVG
jgi:hypothetical protein